MKKFLLALLAIVTCIGAKGADVTGALTNVTSPTITYQSVDANNDPITLSAKLFYKTDKPLEFVMINCHPTITHDDGRPTSDNAQLGVVKYMASEYALVVCPDYIGFGETKRTTHPYMCSTLTARNVLDCYKAAIEYVKTHNGSISKDYYTINVGYSQGGATALAFQRYLETEATDEDRELVNLRGSVCGAGPYSQNIVFDEYEKMTSLDYPIYLLYCLQGHKEAFGQTTMRNLSLEKCFTPDFWEACQGEDGFLAKLNAKETNVDDLNTLVKNAGFTTFKSIINKEYYNHNSNVYRIIQKTLEQSNLLKEGWTPKVPIIFYHEKTGKDIVVPYACTAKALTRFKDHCTYVDAIDDYDYDSSAGDNYLWHPAAFREYWQSGWAYPGQTTIMIGAAFTGNEKYDFSELSHRAFGARFYVQFLAERACMRPKAPETPTQGTAHNTNIAPATPLHQDFTAAGISTASTYDRVTTAMPYTIPAGKPVFVQFAAPVDGYYFGADAPRYEVTLSNGVAIAYREMEDEEDFEAGKVYLITSEKEETEPVVSMVAGQKVETAESELAWRTLNIRKLNALNGKSYASAYLPFDYESNGYAYIITGNEGDKAVAKQVKTVPAGAGVVLISESAEGSIVLSPITKGKGGDVSENILKGTYKPIQNDKDNYLLFGKCTHTNPHVGFFTNYKELYMLSAYSAYIDKSESASVKGAIEIDFDNDEDAIFSLNENQQNTTIYSIDGTKHSDMGHGINIIRMSDGSVKKVIKK